MFNLEVYYESARMPAGVNGLGHVNTKPNYRMRYNLGN